MKKTLAFAETNRKKNKVKPRQYQYPIHRNNPRIAIIAFEVHHQPAMLHPRPESAYRRASTAFAIKAVKAAKAANAVNSLHKIQTVDELSIKRPKTISNITPVLLRRAKDIKVNTSRVIQMPRIIITKPTSAQ